MNIINTIIEDVKIIAPRIFPDQRGHFFELFRANTYEEIAGNGITFVQDNCSLSKKNVLRGLHYQINRPQGKLISVLSGAIFDVAVDTRPNSPTYKKWVGVTLTAENAKQLWVPPGLAHGFLSLADNTCVLYKCTDYYDPQSEKTLMWNDPSINVEWPIKEGLIIAEKDLRGEYL